MTRVADHVNLTFAPCRRSGPRPIRSSSPGRLGCVPRERGRRQLRRINHLRPPFALDELPPPPSCCLFVEPSLSRSACGLITSVPFRSLQKPGDRLHHLSRTLRSPQVARLPSQLHPCPVSKSPVRTTLKPHVDPPTQASMTSMMQMVDASDS